MLLESKYLQNDSAEINFYVKKTEKTKYTIDDILPNILKTIYHKETQHLQLFFVKKRKVKVLFKDELELRFIITFYLVSGVDSNIYAQLKYAESQGSYFNKFIKDINKIKILRKFQLENEEVHPILDEWEQLVLLYGKKILN